MKKRILHLLMAFAIVFTSLGGMFQLDFKAEAADSNTTSTYIEASDLIYDLMETATTFVVVQHKALGGTHYAYTDSLWEESTGDGATEVGTEYNFRPGSRLVLLTLEDAGNNQIKKTEKVILTSTDGLIRDPDVSADGTKCIFSWKKQASDAFHIYEMELTSGNYEYKQLTFGSGFADFECSYMPNGDILFSSTRAIQTVDCWYTQVANIYKMNADGSNIVRLGYDQVHTTYPVLTDDGRVIYTRWDYNDRTQMYVQGVFQMNPDGTNQTELYGNNSNFPTTLTHTRQVPGTTSKYISIVTGHHTYQAGKLCYVDVSENRDGEDSVVFPFPDNYTIKEGDIDKYAQDGARYQYPYPINDTQFLVSYCASGWASNKANTPFGLWLMDSESKGQVELIAGDATYPSAQVVPVKTKSVFVRPSNVDYSSSVGTYYIADVYTGEAVEGVERGTVKQIRVVALEYRAYAVGATDGVGSGTSDIYSPISTGNGSWDVKNVLGLATVYEDGSAMFTVPSETPVYFQLLDENGQMIQTMRSWSTLMPNEVYSCVGCHENNNTTPPANEGITMAMKAGVETLTPEVWQDEDHDPYNSETAFDYLEEVQPIFDANCISCHNNKVDSYQIIDASSVNESGVTSIPVNYSEEVIIPKESEWEYYISATNNAAAGWNNVGFTGNWSKAKAGFGSNSSSNTSWTGSNNWLFIRKTFTISDLSKYENVRLKFDIFYDDSPIVYINGKEIFRDEGRWTTDYEEFFFVSADLLREGENVIAISINQHTGGRFIDTSFSVLRPTTIVEEKVFGRESEWQYYLSYSNNPTSGWNNTGFTGSWAVGKAGFGDRSNKAPVGTSWTKVSSTDEGQTWLFIRKTFTLTGASKYSNAKMLLDIFYDDSPVVYINGHEIFRDDNKWIDSFTTLEFDVGSYLKEGENVIAISINQHTGGRYIDAAVSLLVSDSTHTTASPFSLEGDLIGSARMSKYFPLSYLVLTGSRPSEGEDSYAGDDEWIGNPINVFTNWVSSMSVPEILSANAYGSAKSNLVKILREGHKNVTLTDTELRTIAAWIDLGVPAYGAYDKNNHWDVAEKREAEEEQNKRDYFDMLNDYARMSIAGTLPEGIINVSFKDSDANKTYTAEANGIVNLYVPVKYAVGDKVVVTLPEGVEYIGFTLNSKMGESIVYCPDGTFTYTITDVSSAVTTISKSYANTTNFVTIRLLNDDEITAKRNLAQNGYDYNRATAQYPHVSASSEHNASTYSNYLAKNAIDGFTNNTSHGAYPVQSWGPTNTGNQWIEVNFGRAVNAEELGIVIRHDAVNNHDTWFKSAKIVMTHKDGTTSTQAISINWAIEEQIFELNTDKPITKLKLTDLVANVSGGWAALTEVSVYGSAIIGEDHIEDPDAPSDDPTDTPQPPIDDPTDDPAAETVKDLTIPNGCSVAETQSIGYVLDNGVKVYVDTLTHVADIARANTSGQVVFYLTKNYTTANRIGINDSGTDDNVYDIIDLTGADLVIDGQSKYSIKSSNARFIHFGNSASGGKLTFKNITLGSDTTGASMQTSANSLILLTLENVTFSIPYPDGDKALIFNTNVKMNGVTRDCKNNTNNTVQSFVWFNYSGVTLRVLNATVTNAGAAFDEVYGNIIVENGTFTCTHMFAKLVGGGSIVTVKNGVFNDCSNGSNAAFRVQSDNNTINLHGGTFNINQYGLVHMQAGYGASSNTVNVYDGTYTIATPTNQVGLFVEANDSSYNTYNVYNGKFTMNGNAGRMFVFNAGTGNTNTTLNIDGGEFYAYKNIFSIRTSSYLSVTVNGGKFTNESAVDDIFWQDGSNLSKVITINGGTFNSCKKTAVANDTNIPTGNGIPTVYGMIYTSSDSPIYINGGTFNVYSDNGNTLAKDCSAQLVTRGSGKVIVSGGTFKGGEYVQINAGSNNFTNSKKVEMPEDNSCEITLTTTKGASIRTKADDSGIRFQGTITKDAIYYMTSLYANGDSAKIFRGVVIIPVDFLEATEGEFTFAALAANGCNWATTNADNGLIDNGDGSYTVRLALTNIKQGNLSREFIAITYVCADTDGVAGISAGDTVIYADEHSEARSIIETAKAALADVKDYKTEEYATELTGYYYARQSDGTYTKTAIESGKPKYSRFTAAQINVLRSYVTVEIDEDDLVFDIFSVLMA